MSSPISTEMRLRQNYNIMYVKLEGIVSYCYPSKNTPADWDAGLKCVVRSKNIEAQNILNWYDDITEDDLLSWYRERVSGFRNFEQYISWLREALN